MADDKAKLAHSYELAEGSSSNSNTNTMAMNQFGDFAPPPPFVEKGGDNVPHVSIEMKELEAGPSAREAQGQEAVAASGSGNAYGDAEENANAEGVPSEPPPEFAPYEAEYFETDDGDVISHDPHLNEDGEALYRFLLSQSQKPPAYTVFLVGSHTETRTRRVHRTINGRSEWHTESYTVTIVDFSFSIYLTPYIAVGPEEYTYPDDVPTFRGLMVKQVMAGRPGSSKEEIVKRKATKEERNAESEDRAAHEAMGIPPWKNLEGVVRWRREASSWTLREWADDYAASKKVLKEFVFTKKIHGWSTTDLTSALIACVRGTGYTGNTSINFSLSCSRIYIRPTNRLSRTLSRTLYKVLLILFLIYPFIWLFKRFSRYGGGRWKVAGAMYGLKEYVDVVEREAYASAPDVLRGEEAMKPSLKARLVRGEDGVLRKLTGYREGEWFKEWEEVVRNAVIGRVQRGEPYVRFEEGPTNPVTQLDGY